MLDAFGFVASYGLGGRGKANLYRSAAPADYAAVETLEHLGVKKVFLLIGSPVEASWDLRQYGFDVEFLRFDVRGVSVRGIVSIANRLRAGLRTDGNLIVCCKHGRTRAGLVVGAWRLLFDNWNMDDVERERAQFGSGWNGSADDEAIRLLLSEIDGMPTGLRKGLEAGIAVRNANG